MDGLVLVKDLQPSQLNMVKVKQYEEITEKEYYHEYGIQTYNAIKNRVKPNHFRTPTTDHNEAKVYLRSGFDSRESSYKDNF